MLASLWEVCASEHLGLFGGEYLCSIRGGIKWEDWDERGSYVVFGALTLAMSSLCFCHLFLFNCISYSLVLLSFCEWRQELQSNMEGGSTKHEKWVNNALRVLWRLLNATFLLIFSRFSRLFPFTHSFSVSLFLQSPLGFLVFCFYLSGASWESPWRLTLVVVLGQSMMGKRARRRRSWFEKGGGGPGSRGCKREELISISTAESLKSLNGTNVHLSVKVIRVAESFKLGSSQWLNHLSALQVKETHANSKN